MRSDRHWIAKKSGSCQFKGKEAKCSDAGKCIKQLLNPVTVCIMCPKRICTANHFSNGQSVKPGHVSLLYTFLY